MSDFIVRLRHDNGFITLRVNAENTEKAMKKVCRLEKAPLSAVVSVKKG